MNFLRVAAAAWPIERHDDWDGFAAKAERWVEEAAAKGAELLLFPEYGSMELTSLVPHGSDLHRSLAEMQPMFAPYRELWSALADKHNAVIAAPSFPVAHGKTFRNEAWVFAPGGLSASQSKLHMTRFETEVWGISGGSDLTLFDLGGATAAIAICYDAEFPDQVQALAAADADLILVPSCTDTEAGYTRVSVSARARAIENQCFMVQSCTVGEAPWSPAVDLNIGTGGIYAPPDRGFPSNGVLALGEHNTPGWTYADLDFAALKKVRAEGQVLNRRDRVERAYGTPERTVLRRKA